MSAAQCISAPVSWLRLEQLRLGELAAGDATSVRQHLETCNACSHCFETIERDHRVLSPLDLAPNAPVVSFDRLKARLRSWLAVGGVAVAAAAAIVFLLLREQPAAEQPTPTDRVAIKGGGDLVLTLVRERGGTQVHDPAHFADGDRFKVALTCSEVGPVPIDVVVIQGETLYRPLGDRLESRCGNNVFVPGAFAADGDAPITVCIAPRINRRRPLVIGGLEGAACATLSPQP